MPEFRVLLVDDKKAVLEAFDWIPPKNMMLSSVCLVPPVI
jgi:hypothetical protein